MIWSYKLYKVSSLVQVAESENEESPVSNTQSINITNHNYPSSNFCIDPKRIRFILLTKILITIHKLAMTNKLSVYLLPRSTNLSKSYCPNIIHCKNNPSTCSNNKGFKSSRPLKEGGRKARFPHLLFYHQAPKLRKSKRTWKRKGTLPHIQEISALTVLRRA